MRSGSLRAAALTIAPWAAYFLLFAIVGWWWLTLAVQGSPSDWAFDFRQFWQGASDVVNGSSPYPSAELLATADDHLDPEGIREVFRFPYPAGAAILLAPFGLLGFHTAAALWSAVLIGSLVAALWISSVRDWRIFAVVISSAPVISSVRLGTLTPLLVLLLAVAWRWRDRWWAVGGALALAIALKLFLWPLVVWLAATRRWAAAAATATASVALTLGAWAVLGFDGMTDYPELARRLAHIVGDRGFSLVALGTEAGLPRGLADTLPWLVGFALLSAVVVVARREGGDRRSFVLALVAAIALTPIVWLHYFALLVIPLAICRPRFTWLWALLWIFWLTPYQTNQGDIWRIASGLAVMGAVAALCVRTPSRRVVVT